MINTSEDYKKAVLEKRKFLAKATCLLKDGTLLEFDKTRLMAGGVLISDATSSSGSFDIGSAIVNQLTLKLNNIDETLNQYDFTDAQLTVWAGLQLEDHVEWLKKGVFNASDPTETPAVLTLKALDNMSKFDKTYDGKIIFPSSIQGIVQHCCSRCGVLLASDSIPNGDYVIHTPIEGDNITYRLLISYCAVIAGCYARCNSEGALELKWYERGAFAENGTHADIKKFSSLSVSNVDVVITGIRVTASNGKDENSKGETYLAGAEGYVLSISGNPFIEYGNAKTIASMLAERIVGMRFRPMNASCVGDPSMEAGDAAVLTDRKGRTYNCYLTNLTYSVGDYASISCDAEPATRHSADRYKEIDKIIADIKEETRHQLSEYGKYLDQMNGLAINAMGYYETVKIQDDGSRITYMHDKPSMGDSKIIYKKSIDGYFWSKDGGETWTGGIDKNGNAVMNVIAAIGLHAEWITSGKLQVSDDEGNIIFLVDMDTKQVLISGDHIRIGGETATDLITTANKNASEALNAAAKARNVTMQLSNDFQAVAVDSDGNYSRFPEHVETSPVVMYGINDITGECTFQIAKSEYVQGTWDNAKKIYTVTGLTADEGWVDIRATYLTIPVVKRFNLVKQYAGNTGPAGKPGADGADGTDGKNGLNVATVYLYQRKTSVPAKPSAAITYTFSTGAATGLTNGWTRTIPTGTAPLYVILATASSMGTTDSIAASEWSTPTIMVENGADGAPGAPGRTYFIEPSTLVLKRGKDAAISPSFVEFKSFYRDGNKAARTAYAGRFKIEESPDGNTWKTIYTSSLNESNIRHSVYSFLTNSVGDAIVTATGEGIGIARDIVMIRCTLYASDGTSNALDTQSVAVVTDVDNLSQEEIFDILTNGGVTQGIYMEGNKLYINGTFMKIGKISSKNGRVYFDLDNNEIVCSKLKASRPWDSTTGVDPGDVIIDISKREYMAHSMSYANIYKEGAEEKGLRIMPAKNGSSDDSSPDSECRIYTKEASMLEIECNAGEYGNFGTAAVSLSDYLAGIYASVPEKDGLIGVTASGKDKTVYVSGALSAGEIDAIKLTVSGPKSRVCRTKNYSKRLLYCYEMPSPMFGDIGTGVIDNSGTCYIYLDDIFAETINTEIEYHVFLQKEGQGDLWVASKEPVFFIVKGTPGLNFAWEIKAKQRDFEYHCLESNETSELDTPDIDYESIGQKLFEEYILEKEHAHESSN